jgi:hypothetical protein
VVGESGALAAREHSGGGPFERGSRRTAYGVNAAENRVQSGGPYAAVDLVWAEAEPEQLLARDIPVLSIGDLGGHPIGALGR